MIGGYMDREIKFRAWDKHERRIGYIDMRLGAAEEDPYERGGAEYLGLWATCPANRKIKYVHMGFVFHPDNRHQVLMQYIGLNDRNGVEVYEGDLYTFDRPTKKKREIYVVKDIQSFFEEKGLAEGDTDNYESWKLNYSKIEVLGNIYENPELLTQKETA